MKFWNLDRTKMVFSKSGFHIIKKYSEEIFQCVNKREILFQ